jgi:hypothetical protein
MPEGENTSSGKDYDDDGDDGDGGDVTQLR